MHLAYKKLAVKNRFVGQAKINFVLWGAEGMELDHILSKPKENARSKKLDNEAGRGKQAV